ncbi:hypothetical protein ACQ4M4_12830 [Leptolyngbya sp. AN02str]|uniref:hypothetical protein n=1 Tax=Leptolyngbya sp. AN02str TaxID=3423363 RepID=UPI003D321C85
MVRRSDREAAIAQVEATLAEVEELVRETRRAQARFERGLDETVQTLDDWGMEIEALLGALDRFVEARPYLQ